MSWKKDQGSPEAHLIYSEKGSVLFHLQQQLLKFNCSERKTHNGGLKLFYLNQFQPSLYSNIYKSHWTCGDFNVQKLPKFLCLKFESQNKENTFKKILTQTHFEGSQKRLN